MADPEKPALPDGAPQEAKDFFDCKSDTYTWPKGKVEWLTIKIDNPFGEGQIEITPEVSFEHGKAAGTIDITVSLGMGISGTVNASVNSDGQLVANDVSTALTPFKDKINDAIKRINDWFKHNHKKLKPAVLRKGAVTLEKTATTGAYAPPVVVPGDEDQNKPVPVSLPMPTQPYEEWDAPVVQSTDGPAASTFLVPMLLLVIGVAVFGLVVGALFLGGPGPVAQTTATPGAAATATPTASPEATKSSEPTATPRPTTSLQAYISGVCVRVKHEPINNYVSYLDWLMFWSGFDVDHFVLSIEGTNDDAPLVLQYDPESQGWTGRLGLHNAGAKPIGSLIAVLDDGTLIDVTPDLVDLLGFDSLDVRYPQEDTFGDCPSPTSP